MQRSNDIPANFYHRVGFIDTNLRRPAERVVTRGRNVTFQTAEVAAPRDLFWDIPRLIDGLRRPSLATGRKVPGENAVHDSMMEPVRLL